MPSSLQDQPDLSPAANVGYPSPVTHISSPVAGYKPNALQPPPIVTQPVSGQAKNGPLADVLMAIPAQVSYHLPPGLRYLANIDQLFITQEVELLEVFIGWETNNRYAIRNNRGQIVFYAVEETGWFVRNCCGRLRSFDIRVLDNYRNEIIHLRREFACDSCCYPCCLQKLQVFAPPGYLVGTVEQSWTLCTPAFDINNEMGHTVLKIEGPICRLSICGDIDFNLLTTDKKAIVGKISKKWSGLAKEWFTDADNFGILFPLDLDLRLKAVMIGACFLIDFMFFESSGNEEARRAQIWLN